MISEKGRWRRQELLNQGCQDLGKWKGRRRKQSESKGKRRRRNIYVQYSMKNSGKGGVERREEEESKCGMCTHLLRRRRCNLWVLSSRQLFLSTAVLELQVLGLGGRGSGGSLLVSVV